MLALDNWVNGSRRPRSPRRLALRRGRPDTHSLGLSLRHRGRALGGDRAAGLYSRVFSARTPAISSSIPRRRSPSSTRRCPNRPRRAPLRAGSRSPASGRRGLALIWIAGTVAVLLVAFVVYNELSASQRAGRRGNGLGDPHAAASAARRRRLPRRFSRPPGRGRRARSPWCSRPPRGCGSRLTEMLAWRVRFRPALQRRFTERAPWCASATPAA
jgi:hypothetical protein